MQYVCSGKNNALFGVELVVGPVDDIENDERHRENAAGDLVNHRHIFDRGKNSNSINLFLKIFKFELIPPFDPQHGQVGQLQLLRFCLESLRALLTESSQARTILLSL